MDKRIEIIKKIENSENFVVKGGAGSGKTYTLIQVIEELLDLNKKIAVITYTNAAKDEIVERLLKKNEYIDFCGTIHNFVWEFMKNYEGELLEETCIFWGENNDVRAGYSVEYDFGYRRIDEENKKLKLGHDDVIQIFKKMCENHEPLYTILSSLYDCILVDEYQDTSQDVVDLLLSKKMNISCGFFGDPIQSIYSDYSLNLDGCTEISKEDNWRSSQKMINFFNDVRSKINNDNIVQKSMNSDLSEYDSKLAFYEVQEFNAEVEKSIEKQLNLKIDVSLFLTHNLGLKNYTTINTTYNKEFANNQRKYSQNRDELYTHVMFFYDLFDVQEGIKFETEFMKKYFDVQLVDTESILKWKEIFTQINKISKIDELKDLEVYDKFNTKIKEEFERIPENTDIGYFKSMYEYNENDSKDKTIFSMKGLEAETILIYLDNGKWYKYNFEKINDRTKKILYVGITRAQKNLILVSNKELDSKFKGIIKEHFESFVLQ